MFVLDHFVSTFMSWPKIVKYRGNQMHLRHLAWVILTLWPPPLQISKGVVKIVPISWVLTTKSCSDYSSPKGVQNRSNCLAKFYGNSLFFNSRTRAGCTRGREWENYAFLVIILSRLLTEVRWGPHLTPHLTFFARFEVRILNFFWCKEWGEVLNFFVRLRKKVIPHFSSIQARKMLKKLKNFQHL